MSTAYAIPTASLPTTRRDDDTVARPIRIDSRAPLASAAGPVSRATYLRRRLAVVAAVVGLALTLVLVVGSGAQADLERPQVDGSAVIEPGQTLWNVAITHAPAGEDPRAYLEQLRQLNGLTGATVPAWTVVLLPAR